MQAGKAMNNQNEWKIKKIDILCAGGVWHKTWALTNGEIAINKKGDGWTVTTIKTGCCSFREFDKYNVWDEAKRARKWLDKNSSASACELALDAANQARTNIQKGVLDKDEYETWSMFTFPEITRALCER